MKNSLIKITAITMIACLSVSCTDFLNPENKEALSPDNFPTTIEQVELQIDASNKGIRSIGLYAFYWYPMIVYLLDHTSDTFGAYDERGSLMRNYADIDTRYLSQAWMDIFKCITLSNTALEGIASYREKHATEAEKAKGGILDYLEGQARFNRALAYWHGQIFCEIKPEGKGLPIVDHTLASLSEMKMARATTAETYNFMINDLKLASQLMHGYNNDKTVPTEWAAKAMYAKALMQAGKIEEAKPVLQEIIDKSGKSLVAFSVYEKMWYGDPANEFNSESLYELDQTTNFTQNGPWAGYTSGHGMAMVYAPWQMYLDIRFRKNNEAKPENDPLLQEYDVNTSAMGGWGNNYIHDGSIRRFGFSADPTPRRTFNPAYDFDAERSLENFPYMFASSNQNYRQECLDLKNNKDLCDPRLMICTGQPLVDETKDDYGRTTYYDKSGELNTHPEILGFAHRKYTNIQGTETKINYSSASNVYMARLADIYLLYAEAMKDSDPAVALEYINKVHRRAYGYEPNAACPYDYKSLTDRTKTVDAGDHLAHDVLKYERWAELFAEGDWWFSIRRWKIGQQEVNYYKTTRVGEIQFIGDAYYVQPVPKIELERNVALKQSEGYSDVK
ncbi:MAG: RagB/SusD family nutrient uptake outer membrane protein [Dysgonamonadaceae bacterium]|jgi:hypothetical protein|nr:RagB/SusD family nutrient uptake outer membrane protein [Dysgonamonadaceae bacterium]